MKVGPTTNVYCRSIAITYFHSLYSFEELCCRVYSILRKQSHFLINLFTLMLSSGIPELQSLDDVSYLRTTLAVEKNEEEARKYFLSKFHSACVDSWTTKIDWVMHALAS